MTKTTIKNLKFEVAYPKPVKLYMSLSYDILSAQYRALYPVQYGEWELWEALWDFVLCITHKEFDRQYCHVISQQNFNPKTMTLDLLGKMTEDLNVCYTIVPCPPYFDAQCIVDALASNGLHDGVLLLIYG